MRRRVRFLIEYIVSIIKIFLLVLCAVFLPQIFLSHINNSSQSNLCFSRPSFKLGLENISDDFLQNLTECHDFSYTIGLITNQTGRDQLGNRNIELLLKRGLKINVIFAPQHGFYGDVGVHCTLQDGVDKDTNIPIINLHQHDDFKKITKQTLHDIDVLIFDIQDAGMRYYSYLNTLLFFLDIAAQYDKIMVVLDRPNLLGSCMEGVVIDANSMLPVPIRHGMTVGELANFCNTYVLKKQANLHVVPMANYDRMGDLHKPLLSRLSPNIASINACYGYSFLGLLGEVSPFDIGVGTDKAFQCILLPESLQFPKQKWYELRALLKERGIESSLYRYFSSRKKQYCSGLRLFVRDINRFSSFNTLLTVLDFFKQAGLSLALSSVFDKAIGTAKVREYLEGTLTKKELEGFINNSLHCFYNKAFNSFMYKPFPKVVMVS